MPRGGSFIVRAAALVACLLSLPSFASDVCERPACRTSSTSTWRPWSPMTRDGSHWP